MSRSFGVAHAVDSDGCLALDRESWRRELFDELGHEIQGATGEPTSILGRFP